MLLSSDWLARRGACASGRLLEQTGRDRYLIDHTIPSSIVKIKGAFLEVRSGKATPTPFRLGDRRNNVHKV